MENFYNRIPKLKAGSKLPKMAQINSALLTFSKKERIVFSVLVATLLLSTLLILNSINNYFMVGVPMYGGSISEGIVGAPRFANPILATSSADQDMVSLVYSGLMRKDSSGNLIPDLAEKYEVSADGLTYTFTLKDNIYFHDGKPVTIDDIVFTINTVKDSVIKSPHKANWDGVTVSKLDEKTIEFKLRQPFASFLENTTLGILPTHLWSGSPIELNSVNTNPVGSGPYMVTNVSKEGSGAIDSYELASFKKFALGRPYIDNIDLHFYSNEDDMVKALENRQVSQISSISPTNAENLKKAGYKIEFAVLPRVFGLFFNQNANRLFADKVVISAINQAIDKDGIVREVLSGYGVIIDGPIPPGMTQYQQSDASNTDSQASREEILQKVEKGLSDDGWTKNSEGYLEKTSQEKKVVKGKSVAVGKKTTTPLEFSISTSDAPELVKAASKIQEDLKVIGIKVDIKTFEVGTLNQDVIRPREYDALLFGQIINNESDLFAFWHSSQRKDPGLNIAMYTNAAVDKILEDASLTINTGARTKKYIQFENEIKKDMPAIFLYTPDFIYVVSSNLMGVSVGHVTFPSDRFAQVYLWNKEKYNVWKIFAH
ncbi:MAG TPA: ABC transporter substrate-binding protein [Candidatus Paceibacterota bacterium]|jgi:peptide/nickel transport system substrate-binding protein|nr:ABC transporter substrate-binding protein [Candidatus Paceibacterota bacterium]